MPEPKKIQENLTIIHTYLSGDNCPSHNHIDNTPPDNCSCPPDQQNWIKIGKTQYFGCSEYKSWK
jgi:hypothetical protein